MDKLAVWIGLKVAVYQTGKLSWFKLNGPGGNEWQFICHKFDWKPNLDPVHFHMVMEEAIAQGAIIRVEKIKIKTAKYMNIKAVIELDGKVITHIASSYQLCIVNGLMKYVNNLNL